MSVTILSMLLSKVGMVCFALTIGMIYYNCNALYLIYPCSNESTFPTQLLFPKGTFMNSHTLTMND